MVGRLRRHVYQFVFALLLVAGVGGLYSTGLNHKLIFDDFWIARSPETLSAPISLGFHIRSLWTASFQAIHQWFGPELYWQRMFNIMLHIANAFLIGFFAYRLLIRALVDEAAGSEVRDVHSALDRLVRTRAAATVATTAWAFNPVSVYAVQYLTQRSTLMATGFVVIMLLFFIAALDTSSRSRQAIWFIAAALAYLMAIFSKEHAAPAIALLLPLYIYWRRPGGRALWAIGLVLSGLAIVAAVSIISIKGWKLGAATEDLVQPYLRELDRLRPGASEQVYILSLINQGWLFFRYGLLWLLPWPAWLSVDIRPPFPLVWYALPQVLGALGLVAVVSGAVWAVLRCRGRTALLGLSVLIPVLLFTTEFAFVRLQEPFVLYRSYLWSVTIPVVLALILLSIFPKRSWLMIGGLLWCAILAGLSYDRIQSLRDDPTAWRDVLSKTDRNDLVNSFGRWRAPHNLAKWDLSERRFEDALFHGQLADRLGAPNGLAKQKIGSALVALRRPQEALPILLAAQAEGYDGDELWVSIGSAYDQLGRSDEAFAAYDRALSGRLPQQFRPSTLLAAGYLANRTRQYDKALTYFSELLKLQPRLPPAVAGYALALAGRGDRVQALALISEAISQEPSATLYHARAVIHAQNGDQQLAAQDIAEAVKREPRNPAYLALQRQLQVGAARP